ncbi:ABC transporter permease [Patescibacteria group bacterium]|nr:ABC transporter permease [Patescibacteria group bacterium]
MIKDYFKLGIKNVKEKKVRSWLTMIGIVASIAIIFVIVSLSLGLSDFVEKTFDEMGMDMIIILPSGMMGMGGSSSENQGIITTDHINQIKRVPGVEDVVYELIGTGTVEYKGEGRFAMISGISENLWDVLGDMSFYSIKEGGHLKKGDTGKVVLGSAYSEDELFGRRVYVGDTIMINGKRFRVEGITTKIGTDEHDKVVMILSDDFREIFDIGNKVDEVIVKVESYEIIDEVAEEIKLRLIRFTDLEEEDFFIIKPDQILNIFNSILIIITGFFLAIAGISLFVGAIGIANTMYTSILERRKEIGLMKAVGAENKNIFYLFLIESGLLGLVGGILGVILGFLMGKGVEYAIYFFTGVDYLNASTPLWLVLSCILFSFFVGSLSGSMPALRAAKTKPTEALREE